MELIDGQTVTRVAALGPDLNAYWCRLMRQAAWRPYRWLLILVPVPLAGLPAADGSDFSAELAASAAHEIRNPLTAIRGILEEMREEWPGLTSEHADVALRELDRINDLLSDLMALMEPRDDRHERIDLRNAVQEAVVACKAMLAAREQRMDVELGSVPLLSVGSALHLHQVLLNLIRNASDASPRSGIITLKLSSEGARCRLDVLDSGPGFPDHVLPHIFEPFFTTKPTGTGLGLSICRRVITAHGGTITAYNRIGGGGVVSIRLPIISGS